MANGSPKVDIFVLGCGRSGTSMVAGLFANSGLFQGARLHPPTHENPKGYFEDGFVNRLNNEILGAVNPSPEVSNGIGYRHDAVGGTAGWLSRVPLSTSIPITDAQRSRIAKVTANRPFCLKDPRFCYLHHHWIKAAPGALSICVFRDPALTVESIMKSLRTRAGLFDVALSVNQAFEVWTLHYLHVLRRHASSGRWLFVHYDQVLSGDGIEKISDFSGIPVDGYFPDPVLRRTESGLEAPSAAAGIYDELMSLAGL